MALLELLDFGDLPCVEPSTCCLGQADVARWVPGNKLFFHGPGEHCQAVVDLKERLRANVLPNAGFGTTLAPEIRAHVAVTIDVLMDMSELHGDHSDGIHHTAALLQMSPRASASGNAASAVSS